jgi:hypothetical protein
MKAYKHLVKHALAKGHTISVWDGEEWQVSHSTKYQNIIEAIESVEEANVVIRLATGGERIGWAQVIPYGLEDDETVVDYICSEFMENWWEEYEKSGTI